MNRLLQYLFQFVSQLWRRLLSLLRRGRHEREMEEEMRFHLEMQIEQNLASGMAAEEARNAARRQFGNQTWLKEVSREMWSLNSIETLIQDLRYGVRTLMKSPGFALVAVLTLALGIGANTAIFSLVNATLLRRLPFKDPDQLVVVWGTAPQSSRRSLSEPNFLDYQKQNRTFGEIAAFGRVDLTLTGGANPERVRGARVSADFFKVLGVQPAIGRAFLPGDDQVGHNAVAILSSSLWQRRFGSDQNIVGQSILIEAKPHTVIGVLPAGFNFTIPGYFATGELWIPTTLKGDETLRGRDYLRVIGRLKTGVNLEQAQTEMSMIAQRLRTEHPQLGEIGAILVPLKEQVVGDVRLMLLLLFGAASFVLLITCANIANLQVARASGRAKEFAIRAALGASRRRVARQLLTESLLLAFFGGVLGAALGWWGPRLLAQLEVGAITPAATIKIDIAVIIYSLLISALTGVVFGLAPALQSSSANLNDSLKEGGKTSGGGVSGQRLRSLLTIIEIALSLTLLIGSGLLLRSFVRLMGVQPGFDTEHVLTSRLFLPAYSYPDPAKQAALYAAATRRLSALPGVKAVGAINALPLTSERHSADFIIQGREDVAASRLPIAETRTVTPNYFRAMDIPLVAGRALTDEDTSAAPPVIMINQSLARRFFPNESPVGRSISFDYPPKAFRWVTIVGIVQDAHDLGLDTQPEPEIYQAYQQNTLPSMNLVLRADGDPRGLAARAREEIRALDKNLPVAGFVLMEDIAASSVVSRRFSLIILSLFAGLAMLLAIVGIYGVMSYTVTQRTHEIGLRRALGAQTIDVVKLILGAGMKLALTGVITGLAAAFGLTRLMATLLFGVTPLDALTFVTVTIVLIFVALLACYIPARRATKVDPLVALRHD